MLLIEKYKKKDFLKKIYIFVVLKNAVQKQYFYNYKVIYSN